MHPVTMELVRCPACTGRLTAEDQSALVCTQCGRRVPIRGGVPRFVAAEQTAYVRSFGRQWNRYDVQRLAEDEATFEAKTGVRLQDLRGRLVLDAGCGGGRYAFVAGRHGAHVVAVDLSIAVERARQVCADLPQVDVLQADLTNLPLASGRFDLVFSIGVLHHTPDTYAAFGSVARMTRPGGRLSVWVYRRNTWWQEGLNRTLRGITTRMAMNTVESLSLVGALLGGVPLVNRTLNKLFNFSSHPDWTNRMCDTFDWYSPRYQHHHTVEEVCAWFAEAGYHDIRVLPPPQGSPLYRWCYDHNLIIGSGVNVTGIRTP